MDNREKFNIKLMVDCERQEPFYPVTHALAIQIIDDGKLKNLLDIISIILNFIRDFGELDINDLLLLGYTNTTAFPGDEGLTLKLQMATILPISQEVIDNDTHPVSGDAVFEFVKNMAPSGEVVDNDLNAVSGDTVYDYILDLLGGTISQNNTRLVTGGDIYNYLISLLPDGEILDGELKAVSGDKIYDALQDLQGGLLWETDPNGTNSIKQKQLPTTLLITNDNEVAIGEYNLSTLDKTLFTVGNGTLSSRKNSIEVTNDLDNSLIVPFKVGQSYEDVSIQKHMRNGQNDIKHLTQVQLDKLIALINERWKASWTFSVANRGGGYYNNNTGIILKWNIKNSENNNNVNITSANIFQKQGSNNYVDLGINVLTSNNESTPYVISDYTLSPLLINFNSNGSGTFTFKMDIVTDELNESSGDKLVSIYAPSYVFCSTNASITSLSNLPSNTKTVTCSSKSLFSTSITIDSNNLLYIYIATPLFINVTRPTADNQPFKDADSGFEFSLSNDYYANSSITCTVCNKSTTTIYNIVRSDQLLTQGTTWNIKGK